VAAWLEGKAAAPDKAHPVEPALADNLRIQDRVAQNLRAQRLKRGALETPNTGKRGRFLTAMR